MRRKRNLDLLTIVQTAAKAADEVGLQHVTLADLASRLSIKPPSMYNHIASLDELHRQLALFGMRALYDEVARSAVGQSGVDGILSVARAFRAFAIKHPGLYGATVRAPKPTDIDLIAFASDLFEVIRAVLAPFHLPEDDLVHAMRMFRSAVHGFIALEAAGGFGLAQRVDASFEYMIDALSRSIVRSTSSA
jgi:AcrR family transcriptional regulator